MLSTIVTTSLVHSSNIWVCGCNTISPHSNEKSSVVLSHGTIYLVGGKRLFELLDKMVWCDHSNETSFHLKQYFHMVLNLFST